MLFNAWRETDKERDGQTKGYLFNARRQTTDRYRVTCSMPGDRRDRRRVTCSLPGDRQTDRQRQTQTDKQTRGYLLNARFFRVEERPGLHVFGHQVTAHLGDLVPVVEGRQGQVLVRRLLHTCGGKGGT